MTKYAMLLTVILLSGALDARAQDSDADGICDAGDNCLAHSNVGQVDADLDGYGNRCDTDFDQDGDSDQDDQDIILSGSCGPECDLNSNGVFDFGDLGLFGQLVGHPPGPSGLACAGTVPCEASPDACPEPPGVPALGSTIQVGLVLTLIASAIAIRRRHRSAAAGAADRYSA